MKPSWQLLFVWVFLCFSSPISPAQTPQFIMWNVGQGLWTTLSTELVCYHFDMGGEFWPRATIQSECANKRQMIFLSHWDLDHIGLVRAAARLLRRPCLAMGPSSRPPTLKKQRWISDLGDCRSLPSEIQSIFPDQDFKPRKRENENSRVLVVWDRILAPGDSPTSIEKKWVNGISKPHSIRFLLVGHHGSQTSTGLRLLEALPGLKMALISARKKRYGHPHAYALQRLKKFGVAALRTEDWGTLRIEMAPRSPNETRTDCAPVRTYKDDTPGQDHARPARTPHTHHRH